MGKSFGGAGPVDRRDGSASNPWHATRVGNALQPSKAASAARGRRRGFALLTVVALVAIIGMAIVAMSSAFAADAARTRAGVRDVQVRQLLLAGAGVAGDAVAGWDGAPREVKLELPGDLAGASLVVRMKGVGEEVEAEVEAEVEGRRGWQTVRYTRWAGGGWVVARAELGGW